MENLGLFLDLKKLRTKLAGEEDVPPFFIFPDSSLKEMAEKKPCDENAFKKINGVGSIKLKKYGAVFISEIHKYCEDHGTHPIKLDSTVAPVSGDALERLYKLNQEISDINDKLKELTNLKSELLDQVVKAGINLQGKYSLQSSSISVRQLNLEAFKQLYPQVFMEIGSVKLSDADRVLGKAEVTELCTLKESITYKVVEM